MFSDGEHSQDLSALLLVRLRGDFANQLILATPEKQVLARFCSPSADVGCLDVFVEGDEVTLFLGDRTHQHFACFEIGLDEQEKTERVVADVVAFLQKLFADRIEFYGGRYGGGCRERQTEARGWLPKRMFGERTFVWSGPIDPF